MSKQRDYLNEIANAKSRHEAATLIRAFGCQVVQGLSNYAPGQRLEMLEGYARHADALDRDYSIDGDVTCAEDDHPWREWLVEWGYAPNASALGNRQEAAHQRYFALFAAPHRSDAEQIAAADNFYQEFQARHAICRDHFNGEHDLGDLQVQDARDDAGCELCDGASKEVADVLDLLGPTTNEPPMTTSLMTLDSYAHSYAAEPPRKRPHPAALMSRALMARDWVWAAGLLDKRPSLAVTAHRSGAMAIEYRGQRIARFAVDGGTDPRRTLRAHFMMLAGQTGGAR